MKKIYLSLFSLALTSIVFSQSITKTNKVKRAKSFVNVTENVKDKPLSINNNKIDIWTNDFSVPADWVMVNNSTPTLDWSISTANLPSAWGSGAFGSTTAANGYALIDSDALGDGSTQDATITTATPIDLSAYPAVLLSFQQYHARYLEQTLVLVSGDNGGTWTTYELNTDVAVNGNTTNPDLVEINISTVAGGQSQVLVAFQYIGAWDYGWAVDDLKISEAAANDVSVSKTFTHDIVNAYDYSIVPKGQMQPLVVGGIVFNIGSNPANQRSVDVIINDGTSDVYNQATLFDLAMSVEDTIWVETGFVPVENKLYTVQFILDADDVSTNDTSDISFFMTTPFVYGQDFTTTGVYRFDKDDETAMGNIFEIYNATNITAADVKFETGTTAPEARIKVSRFNFDDATYNSVQAMEEIYEFPYTIVPANIGSGEFTRIVFPQPVVAESGWYYVLEVRKDFGANRIFVGGSAEGDDDYSTVNFGPFGENSAVNYFTGWGFAPAIRMVFAPTILSSDADNVICLGSTVTLTSSFDSGNEWSTGATTQSIVVTEAGTYTLSVQGETATTVITYVDCAGLNENNTSSFSVFPNPSNGTFTISADKLASYETVELVDQVGRVIGTWKISNTTMNISTKNVVKGNYNLVVKGQNGILVQKLMID